MEFGMLNNFAFNPIKKIFNIFFNTHQKMVLK